VENVCVSEVDGNVRVGVSRTVIFEDKRRPIDMKLLLLFEELRWQRAFRRRRKREIPTFDSCAHRKVLSCVLVSSDLGTYRVKPLVAVSMIEMPMCVYQVPDRIGADVRQRFTDRGSRRSDAGIHEQLSIGACQHGDISTGAFEHAYIATQFMSCNFGRGGRAAESIDRALRRRRE